MGPLCARDVLGCLALLTVENMLLGVFGNLKSISQFKIKYGMESDLYVLNHLRLVLYGPAVAHQCVGVPRTTTSMACTL